MKRKRKKKKKIHIHIFLHMEMEVGFTSKNILKEVLKDVLHFPMVIPCICIFYALDTLKSHAKP
jgi:hypothetical protein